MAHVFQVGAGSGGIVVLDLLARDPRVTRVTLIEPDVYKPHNVHRHLFPASAVGRPKGELAADWLLERRPELAIEVLKVDLTSPDHQPDIERAAATCDVGVCAADNESAKYHFDQLMRQNGKPWSLGEVLSGGIAGWVHRFTPDGPCYGCVASYLQRSAPGDPVAPAPDYADPNGQVRETSIPASKASIDAVASLHALITLDLLDRPSGPSPTAITSSPNSDDFTSLLFTLARVPDVFDEPYRTHKFRVPRSLTCLICSAVPAPPGEVLDAALDQALARLGHV
jgi:molybdopterin/thiamine biosynthesis adenylyltransferase